MYSTKIVLVSLLFIMTLTSCSKVNNIVKNTINETSDDINNQVTIEAENENNDFFEVLNSIKEIHPGTIGSNLKVLYVAYKFLNSCRARLPFDIIAADWISKQNEEDYPNINESFSFVYDNLDNFNSDNIKDLLNNAGIELPSGTSFEGIIDEAKKVLNVVIDKTK